MKNATHLDEADKNAMVESRRALNEASNALAVLREQEAQLRRDAAKLEAEKLQALGATLFFEKHVREKYGLSENDELDLTTGELFRKGDTDAG